MIREFQGRNRYLSNFGECPHPVPYEALEFARSEMAFQAAKTLDFRERWAFTKLPGTHAGCVEAKRMGRALVLRPDWDRVRVPVMWEIVVLKYAANPELRSRLVDTYPNRLIEGNVWHDTFWGVCNCPRHGGEGENQLGLITERVRQLWLR